MLTYKKDPFFHICFVFDPASKHKKDPFLCYSCTARKIFFSQQFCINNSDNICVGHLHTGGPTDNIKLFCSDLVEDQPELIAV